ncbi:carbohydrate ABC transporter permease [Candidatus Hydrogenedentota bacterium]
MSAPNQKNILNRLLFLHIPLFLAVIYILFPIYWTLNTSLLSEEHLFSEDGVQYFPDNPTLANYKSVLTESHLARFFVNSAIVAGCTCALLIFIATFSGYAMAKFRFRGKKAAILMLFGTQMFPGVLLTIPLYIMLSGALRKLGISNSFISLILPYAAFSIPFSTILMRGFFMGVPDELEEAAMVDGCSRFSAFLRISLPLTLPGIVATGIFCFIGAWNELLLAVMMISDAKKMTLPVGLNTLIGAYEINWGHTCAAAITALLPAMLLFGYVQRYLVGGIASGAVKG